MEGMEAVPGKHQEAALQERTEEHPGAFREVAKCLSLEKEPGERHKSEDQLHRRRQYYHPQWGRRMRDQIDPSGLCGRPAAP